jgi:hypothetical protein
MQDKSSNFRFAMNNRGEKEKEREREGVLTLAPHAPTDGRKGSRDRGRGRV